MNKLDILENPVEVEVETVFGKPSDKLVCGKINGVECVIMARHDREHLTNPTNVNYRANVLALKNAGCTVIVATTACGSLNENFKPGDLAILDDFIDRTTKRSQTYYDNSQPESFHRICHIPMYPAFSSELRQILIDECAEQKVSFHKTGTIVTIEGPRFSSRAESKSFQQMNGHLINMTTCPEVVLAKELGIPYASIAIVTDYDCWRENSDEHVGVEAVLKAFRATLSKVTNVIVGVIPKIAKYDWESVIKQNEVLVKSSLV